MAARQNNMSNLILNQLIELFPTYCEEFLSGIYDAHKDDDATVEELIEVILSFEYPPLRENVNEQNLAVNNPNSNELTNIKEELDSEVPFVTISSNVNPCVKEEVLQNSSEPNSDLPSKSKMTLAEQCQEVVLNSNSKDISNRVLCDEIEKLNDLKTKTKIEGNKLQNESNSDINIKITEKSVAKIKSSEMNEHTSKTDTATCPQNSEWFDNEDDDDSAPECSIKYLMRESGIERYNIAIHTDELGEIPEENMEYPLGNSTQSNYSAVSPTTNVVSSSGKSTGAKKKKICQYQKRINHSNLFQSSCSQALPHFSNKKITSRSCKVKNEEERLRRKLINLTKLLHERQEKDTNTVLHPSQFLDFDNKYSLLCKVFTDADPNYLLDRCSFLTNEEQILAFISENLELRDYPKVKTVKEEPRLMDEFHCTIPKFLEVIPDPREEFSSSKYLRAGYEGNAEIYLLARYGELSEEEVKYLLRATGYNLTLVCEQLEEQGKIPTPGVLDYTPLRHPATICFHQEVWYIEHSKEVQEYLDSAIEAIRIQEELNRPPTPPEVFECEICRDEVQYVELGTCDGPTGHLFCKDCIKRSVEVKIGDGATDFPCLVNCGNIISLQTVKELLPSNVYDKLMWRISEKEIYLANIAGVETCPFCPYAYGPGEERLFTCLNPFCMKLSCRLCRMEDHSPELCTMLKNEDEERARHIIEDRMAETLMRKCYSCGKNFVKSTGCNKMECTCGAKMCYVCRQPVLDYSHFNGPNGDNTDRCPLFSEDTELHDRPVEAIAEQVFNEIAANNPELNLDRAKLIPK